MDLTRLANGTDISILVDNKNKLYNSTKCSIEEFAPQERK